jgi:CubicO group peptidase (beta-lactamase class C family)
MDVRGTADKGFSPVRDAFALVMATQRGTGGGLAAWYDDRRVIDLWGGFVDADRRRLWGPDSLVQPYSVCKPFAAVCLLKLVDDGRVDLDARVQSYWPEFRAQATVRHLLSHQAGVVAIDLPAPTETIYRWGEVCRLLAGQEPAWIPGRAHGESALFYGHLVGELVRRVDGRSLGRFLRDEICGPLELDFAVGLDSSQQTRAVTLTGLDEAFRSSTLSGRPALYARAISNPPGALDAAVVNGAAWRAAEIPAVNGHGTARAMADFYHALAAGQLLSAGLLAEAVTANARVPTSWSARASPGDLDSV